MYHFEKLEIWHKAMTLVESIYSVTENFPSKEKFNLTDQILRSAVSIPVNIAEGSGRNSKKEFMQFLSIARGSLYETITLLFIAKKRNYLENNTFDQVLTTTDSINKMLSKLMSSLQNTI
jgi:four helix bundle protein